MAGLKELIIGANDAGQRLDRFLSKAFPALPSSMLQKCIRLKRIKLNGKRAERSTLLNEGDLLQLYINDEFLETPSSEDSWRLVKKPSFGILYEDGNILLADKPKGMPVHPDETESIHTLISHIKAYLYSSGEWEPENELSFAPALCNRIDRNTRGIVIAAKNAESLRIINQKIKNHELVKGYLCVIHGVMEPASGRLTGYIVKDAKKNQVYVKDSYQPGAKTAITDYNTLETADSLSLVECTLLTGRTHQIRAQFAHAGHPLLGDGKYGRESQNKRYGLTSQALFSYRLMFDFKTTAGILEYLNGRSFSLDTQQFISLFREISGRK